MNPLSARTRFIRVSSLRGYRCELRARQTFPLPGAFYF